MSRENLPASASMPTIDHPSAQGPFQPLQPRAPLPCTGHMPRVLRMPVVTGRTGLSRSHIYAEVKARRFPAPVTLSSRAVGWLESEIDAWIAQRIAASRSAT